MAHFALLWKARTIEKYRQNYENEKINSIIMSNSDIPERTIFQRWRHYRHGMQKRLSRTFSKWYPEGSTVSNFFVSIRTDMKLPNILLRSLYGFVGGLLLTYLGFMFFVFQLSLSLMHATVLSSVMGILLTLGLTFSNRMRCLIFLLVPQLFSRVGRYTLTCYALVLILTGPATNTLKNSEVLSESMACSQEQIKLSVRHINDSFKKPFNSIKDSLKITIQSMKVVVRKLKVALIRINRLILSIASVIQSGFSWLVSVADVCNEALGTPQEKCLNALKENLKTCNEHYNMDLVKSKYKKRSNINLIKKLLDAIGVKNVKGFRDKDNVENKDYKKPKAKEHFGVIHNEISKVKELNKNMKRFNQKSYYRPWFCNTDYVAEIICAPLKQYDKFCVPADFAEETLLATIRKKLKTFVHRIAALIRVQLNIEYTYTFIGNSSSTNQVAAGIVTEIRNRADPILTWLSWSSCVTSLFLLLIIFRAKHYQHMFETRSRFDNRFITKEFRELDLKRLREGRETVLPLNRRERLKYVTTTSFRLVASEKVHLNRSAVFMTVTTFKLLIHIVADYSLYWVLMTIRHHGKMQSPLQPEIADTGAFITGVGFVPRLLQSFIDTLNIQLSLPPPDNSCLPNPYPPDVNRYCQIGFLIFLLWFFALFEPYGLRLRHLIMGHYRPQRAKARAVWLYNHILRTRASFMKFARRRLHREYKYSSESKHTIRRCLQTYIPVCWLRSLLGIKPDEPHCLLCNITEDTCDPKMELIKCEVPYCPGTYCASCFSVIGQLCTICLSPSDYGDVSDVSLEKGSSDEDYDDDEDSNDYDPDNSNPNVGNRRNASDGANTSKDANNSRTRSNSRQSRVFSLGKIENKSGETFPLLQRSGMVYNPNNHRLYQIKNKDIYAGKSEVIENQLVFLHMKAQETIKKESIDYIGIFQDNNCNMINARRTMSTIDLLLYSVYKITRKPLEIKKIEYTTQLAKYLQMKKIIKCKQKKVKRSNSKYFMTCSNNNLNAMNETFTNGNEELAKDSNNLGKPKIPTNNKLFNTLFKDRSSKTETPENKNSKNDTTNSLYHRNMTIFHATFFKYWKNVKLKFPCKDLKQTKRDSPPTREQKHKRKKKRKETKSYTGILTETSKINKNEDKIGKSRIFAYLDERDWAKNRFDDIKRVNTDKKRSSLKSSEIRAPKNITVNKIVVPRLILSSSSESVLEPTMHDNIYIRSNHSAGQEMSDITEGTEFADSALQRFFKSIADSSCELEENGEDVEEYYEVTKQKVYSKVHVEDSIAISHADSLHCVPYANFDSQEDAKGLLRNRILNPLSALKSHVSSLFLRLKRGETIYTKDQNKKKQENIVIEKSIALNVNERFEEIQKLSSSRSSVIVNETGRRFEQPKEKYKEQTKTNVKLNLIKTDNKAVTAFPIYNSCGCQCNFDKVPIQDFVVQVIEPTIDQRRRPISRGYDVAVMTGNPTCTCAVQYQKQGIPCSSKKWVDDSEDSVLSVDIVEDTWQSFTDSEDSKTDTTVCSLANMEYHKTIASHGNNKAGRIGGKVVTKSNQSTLTDKCKHCDVSTATYDWWSPIVDKKDISKKETRQVEKKNRNYNLATQKERKLFKNRGMSTAEKIVKFRSTTQLIPSRELEFTDIMSPSRYLLESQKYYNELFYNKFASPRVFPVVNLQKNHNMERDRSQLSSRHHRHRGRKAKRLDESYTLKKQASPRIRRVESVRTPETSRRCRRNLR